MSKRHGASLIRCSRRGPRSSNTSRTPGDRVRSIKESHPPEGGRTRLSRVNPNRDVSMKIEIFADADAVARQAADIIAADARAAVAARGRFIMAVSGGHTPWVMLRDLAEDEVPWANVHLAQVDERVAPTGHPDRNLTHLHESLLEHAPLPPEQLYAMPVESADLEAAAKQYAATLEAIAGSPPVLDLVHLGL